MSALKPIKWQKFEKVLLQLGCEFVRQQGGHRIYRCPEIVRPVVVPAHPSPIPVFVIRNNLRLLGVKPKDYKEILKKIR